MREDPPQRPLCVDLDGTLLKTDTLLESSLALIGHHCWHIFLLPFWLARGKAHLKHEIAKRVDLQVANLPYHQDLLLFLKKEREAGRKLVLITASHRKFACAIASHLGIFERDIHCTDDGINMKGQTKLKVLLEKYGPRGFDYAGDSYADLVIWSQANAAIVINPSRLLLHRVQRVTTVKQVFYNQSNLVLLALKQGRIHQWAKNCLVLVPLIASHNFWDTSLIIASMLAFLSFGFCASSVYTLNDLLDLEADRQHQQKKNRPIASGALSISFGIGLIITGIAASWLFSMFLPPLFSAILFLYAALAIVYSFYLKQVVLIDVLALALLYIIRIYGGGTATNITPSHWLLTFSLFMFMSLAHMKRFSELQGLRHTEKQDMVRRGYRIADLEHLASVGSASGYISVLVLALYVSSKEVLALYSKPEALWLLCPLLMYWISRAWLLAYRGRMNYDPVIFALTDKKTHLIIFFMGVILVLAK